MSYRLIPRRKLKGLEQTVSISTLQAVISPTSTIVNADGTLADITAKFNNLLDELRAAKVLGRKTGGKREV